MDKKKVIHTSQLKIGEKIPEGYIIIDDEDEQDDAVELARIACELANMASDMAKKALWLAAIGFIIPAAIMIMALFLK